MLKHGETPVNFLRPAQVLFALENGSFPDDFIPQRVTIYGKEGRQEDITALSLATSAWGAVTNLHFPLELAEATILDRWEAMGRLNPIIRGAAALAIGAEHQV